MKSKLKQSIRNIPFIGHGLGVLSQAWHAPARQQELRDRIEQLETIARESGKLFANNHELDVFYTRFEDTFRGSEDSVRERLLEYVPDFTTKTKLDFTTHPVLDIGSGRGEFLKVMADNNVPAAGIDINNDMVQRAKDKGLDVIQGDAVEYLTSKGPDSFGAITGFHIVEHIPFENLLQLFSAAHQALIQDGFVLFETPNPENVVVGSCTFYMDPSHLHPIPPALLAFALESVGFRNVEIRRLHAVDTAEYDATGLSAEVVDKLYGPRDYAVIGYK